jgi:hypothetical protein
MYKHIENSGTHLLRPFDPKQAVLNPQSSHPVLGQRDLYTPKSKHKIKTI